MLWPESQVVNKGRTSLGSSSQSEHSRTAAVRLQHDELPLRQVPVVPPGNHPYEAFSEDSADHQRWGPLPRTDPTMPYAWQQLDELRVVPGASPSWAGDTRASPIPRSAEQFQRPQSTLVYSMVWHVMFFGIDVGLAPLQREGSNDSIAPVVPSFPRPIHAVGAAQLRGFLRVPARHCGSHLRAHCFDVGSEHADLVCPAPRDDADHDRRATELLLSAAGVSPIGKGRLGFPRCLCIVQRQDPPVSA